MEVERVQISCWEGTSRPAVDPPCCRCGHSAVFSFGVVPFFLFDQSDVSKKKRRRKYKNYKTEMPKEKTKVPKRNFYIVTSRKSHTLAIFF